MPSLPHATSSGRPYQDSSSDGDGACRRPSTPTGSRSATTISRPCAAPSTAPPSSSAVDSPAEFERLAAMLRERVVGELFWEAIKAKTAGDHKISYRLR